MRRRLTVAIAGVAALAVILFAIPLALALRRTYRDDELLRLQRDAVAATRAIDFGGSSDPVELPASPRALAVYDATGSRVAGRAGPARADALTRAAIAHRRPLDRADPGASWSPYRWWSGSG